MMELSLIAQCDDLRRCTDVLTDGTAEIEFRQFLNVQKEGREQWQATVAEAQRLQRELDRANQERSELEKNLFHARRLLENESKARRAAEADLDARQKTLSQVIELLNGGREIDDETRSKFAFLDAPMRKRKSKSNRFLEHVNEINSTGSFLSDLSVTQSDEDFLDVSKPFKKHRPSSTGLNGSFSDAKKQRRSLRKSINEFHKRSQNLGENVEVIDLNDSEKIIATTTVSIPQGDGPIEATSTLQAIPSVLYAQVSKMAAEKPYERGVGKENTPTSPTRTVTMGTPYRQSMKMQEQYPVPSAPPLHEINTQPKLLLNLQGRVHEFASRTMLRLCNCAHCGKRFKFGTSGLKCGTCGISVHQDCKFSLAMGCIPKSQGTPKAKGTPGIISDYVPVEGPLVPGLIVRCINEVETRGLTEEGIYRVSGSEKEVKALEERFLHGRGIPVLANYDIHVICGCIKYFLRHLREPLIPTRLWVSFANAVRNPNDREAVRDLYESIKQLPQANRDTLAYLILHLQRVATCNKVKMPIDNLAKIFGPTVVGYSSPEVDQHKMIHETTIQKEVMQHLLEIPTDYWAIYINADSSESDAPTVQAQAYFGTPGNRMNNTMRRERKFFATPPTRR